MNSGRLKYDLNFKISGEDDQIIVKPTTSKDRSFRVTCMEKVALSNVKESQKVFYLKFYDNELLKFKQYRSQKAVQMK